MSSKTLLGKRALNLKVDALYVLSEVADCKCLTLDGRLGEPDNVTNHA